MKTAAIILIGNELLSGKIVDTNAAYLIKRLRALGVALRRVCIVADVRAEIADEVRRCSAQWDVVFTSGGVGPTHDDVTLESIAAAFEVPIERHPRLAGILSKHFGDRLTEAHLRMADLPAGTELIEGGQIRWPVVKCRNVFVLPGVPQIFRAKFEAIADRFRDVAFRLRSVYLDADEGTIAGELEGLEARFGVSIGSYPKLFDTDHRLQVTVESLDGGAVDRAVEYLLDTLEARQIVRVDPPTTEDPPDNLTG